VDTWASIDTPLFLEGGRDFLGEFGIFSAVLAGFTVAPSVIATHRHL
jgi:hypothetical protein